MRVDVVTLFPEMVRDFCRYGIPRIALERGLLALGTWNPRDYAANRHRNVDDRPYGGGPGMVMQVQPVRDAIEAARAQGNGPVIYLSPQGRRLDQRAVRRMAELSHTILLAGCYDGIDERLIELVEKVRFDRTPLNDIKSITVPVDIGLIEGGVCNTENIETLRKFREKCRILIAVGACAMTGGVPALRNDLDVRDLLEASYIDGIGVTDAQIPTDPELPHILEKVSPIHEVVKVDFFLPGCPPPADAFWSITMYHADTRLMVHNPIQRYSIGDRTRGLEYGDDGSLTIYIQHQSPGATKESNWLPAPGGPFYLIARAYVPKESMLSGAYRLPAVKMSR